LRAFEEFGEKTLSVFGGKLSRYINLGADQTSGALFQKFYGKRLEEHGSHLAALAGVYKDKGPRFRPDAEPSAGFGYRQGEEFGEGQGKVQASLNIC